jgi:hypothetical protein
MKGKEFDLTVMQIAEQYGKIWSNQRIKMEDERRSHETTRVRREGDDRR